MPNKNAIKEDATKRLIDLLRETDTEDAPKADALKSKEEESQSQQLLRPDEVSEDSETKSELMQFLVKDENPEPEPEAADEDDVMIPNNQVIDDDETLEDLLGSASSDTQSESSAVSPSLDLQSLLANLDSRMNNDDDLEILGGGNRPPEKSQDPFVGITPIKTETPRPEVIDKQMVNAVPKVTPEPQNVQRPSLKYLKKFNYDTLYDSEKVTDDEYIQTWNTSAFFKSVLYLKDTAIGLDFGDDFIRYVEIKKRQDKLEISNWGCVQMIQDGAASNTGFAKKKSEDNFSVVFNAYATQNRFRNKYIAHAIQNKNIVSRLLSFPKLSPSEVRDAIELNARKNLPFPDKFAQIDYAEIGVSGEAQKKYHYLVGIAHERTVNSIATRFKEAGIVPRKLFSASFAIWSLFKNNYPDLEDQSVILLHMGQDTSSIVFVNDGIIQFDREIAVGARDFRDALAQKVNTLDGDRIVTQNEADLLKLWYGFPIDQEGVTEYLHIESFKLLILLRSEGERLISEINRSIDFYRKVYSMPPLESDIFLSGTGSKIPGLATYISRQLNRNVRRLYSMRTSSLRYAEGIDPIPTDFLPDFDLPIAAATEIENHTNLIPKNLKFEEKFIPVYMGSIIILLLTLLAITVSSFAVSSQLGKANSELAAIEKEIESSAPMGRKYSDMISFHNAAYSIKNEMNRDSYYSRAINDILKTLSTNTQDEIKFRQVIFNSNRMEKAGTGQVKAAAEQNPELVFVHLTGFVSTSNAIADLVLSNYLVKLENSGFFSSVDLLTKDREVHKENVRLNFYIQAQIKE